MAEIFLFLGVALAAALVMAAVYVMFVRSKQNKERILAIKNAGQAAGMRAAAGGSSLLYRPQSQQFQAITKFVNRLAEERNEKNKQLTKQSMVRAGFYNPNAVQIYTLARFSCAIAGALIVAIVVAFFVTQYPPTYDMMAVFFGAGLGFYIPILYVDFRVSGRKAQFTRGFPDAIDMLFVGVEAGYTMSAALRKTYGELRGVHPIIAEQLEIVALEMQAGIDRSTALRHLADRVNTAEISSFVSMIIQSESLGTSLSHTLRVYAAEMRNNRMLKVEEKANALPAKMAIPLVLFIFPFLMSIILIPVILRFLAAGFI